MKITYIGHATLLIEIGGVRVLTDPNFDDALGVFLPRVTPPSMQPRDVPRPDVLLVSHAHADHLSFDSLRALPTPVIAFAPPAIARWMSRRGYATQSVAPGEVRSVGDGTLRVHAARATHMGARYGFDRWRGAANMYLLETDAESCLFAGDTSLASEAESLVRRALGEKQRRLDVALLPIGYAPRWKQRSFRRGHLTAEDALELFTRLDARHFMPYHWGTFRHVTATAYDAIDRLRPLVTAHARGADVRIVEPGDTLTVKPARA